MSTDKMSETQQLDEFNRLFYEGLKERHQIIIEDGQLAPGDVLPVKAGAETES